MRLDRLELVRFGHFSDHVLDLGPPGGPGFHVIVGRNEAGKSTLVEAWLNLLYGIPLNTTHAFRHPRPTLEIRAVVDDGAGPVTLTRTARRTGDLVDGTGAPVPPALLTAMLRGVSEEAYRALYCLDDATIERGGEDILASRGDLGQLLFAAASGMEAFNADLEAERAADQSFQRRGPGRQSTEVFRLKKVLDDLKKDRDRLDLTAPEHRRMRAAVEAAAADEQAARARHADLTQEDTHLRACQMALPVKVELDDLAASLAALGDPPAIGEGAAAAMADLDRRRTAHQSTLRARSADLARQSAEREAIAVDAAAAQLPGLLADLAGLRNRAAADAEDLPRRLDEAESVRGQAVRLLNDLGLGDSDPSDMRLARPALEALDRAVRERDQALRDLGLARSERDRAAAALKAAEAEAADVEAAATGADPAAADNLRRLLADGTAERLARDVAEAERLHRDAAEAAQTAREALSVGATAFATCPDVALAPDAGQALAERLRDHDARRQQLRDRLAEDRERIARLDARVAALSAQGADASDRAAAAARTRRDGLWQTHRAALTGPTADAFAAALADEDSLTAMRLAEGARLADLRQLDLDRAETRATEAARVRDLAAAEDDLAAQQAALAGHLAAAGLPATMGAPAFAAWLADHARAAAAGRAEQAAARTLADLCQRAAPLWQALTEALGGVQARALTGAPGAGSGQVVPDALGRMVGAAVLRLSDLEAEARIRDGAARAVAAAAQALAERTGAIETAERTLADTGDGLTGAVRALDLELPDALDLADALPLLRELAASCAALAGLTDRIGKMQENAAAFAAAVARIAEPWPDLAQLPPLAQAGALDRLATRAGKDVDRRATLTEGIADAERRIAEARRELAAIDGDARRLASAFPAPPEDFEAIREAVARASEAERLRGEIRKAGTRLNALLGTATTDEARALLDGSTEADLQARRQVLAPDLAAAEAARDQAIRARVLAEEALKATGAGDDAARLAQDCRTALEDLRTRTETGLVRRLALMLSERALARYRDRHRSDMLADTAQTFADLTDGAYPALTTQQTDKGDVLIARRASDGHSLRADAASMSKGTRFQLYLALRLAGYRQMASGGTVLPFLCDDVFETFDEARTAAACRLMRRIAGLGQALYFTHHAHVAEIARAECGDGVTIHRL